MSTKQPSTQKQKILKRLTSKAGKITRAQAAQMGILSLPSRINELRKDGHAINAVPVTRKGVTVVDYVLAT